MAGDRFVHPDGTIPYPPMNPMTFGPSKEHTTMTSPTQRRHDEIIGRLDALIDAVQSTTARDHLHRLLAEESAAERRGEPVDVTEEPPVGSQVTDVNGDVWHRRDDIVWRLVAYRDKSGSFGGAPWGHVRQFAPLRLTTEADRERVGLPVDTAPDVDPDDDELPHALNAEVVRLVRAGHVTVDTRLLGMDFERNLARAAREHIEAEREEGGYNIRRAERERERRVKAEADVERLTRERDEWEAKYRQVDDLLSRARDERDDLRGRVDDLIRERGQAIERYKALRADVTAHALHHAHDQSSLAFDCFATTLEDDDKRGRDA